MGKKYKTLSKIRETLLPITWGEWELEVSNYQEQSDYITLDFVYSDHSLAPEVITLLDANRLNLYIEDRKSIKDKYTSSKNYNDISIGILVPSFLAIVVIGLDPSHPQIRNLTSMKSVPFVAFAGFLGLAFASAIYCKLTSTKMESLSLINNICYGTI